MSSKRAIIILGDNIDNHKLKVFNLMVDYYKWDFFVISWFNNIIDNSLLIKYFDLDKILYLQHKIIPFFNNQDLTRTYFERIKPNLLIFVGDFINKKLKDIPSNKIPRILIGKVFDYKIDFDKIIEDSVIFQVTNSKIDYVPYPKINYQDFLDFDTGESLKIKQDNNLILYENGIISKKKVVAFSTILDEPSLLKSLINNEGYKYVNINNIIDSEILIPEIDEDNSPVIFEVIDMLVINQNINDKIIKNILWSMASGTILILPRKDEYINFVGNGAIYYKENSTSELKACLQILENNSRKVKEVRDNAISVLQKKFSYKSISKSLESIFEKIVY